ncbi:hypothetical protein HPP92_013743 [Vanilla planifolia]|uniref:Uncharacterized protein n=1 Tax=Vanilla planifolia TaxID=51239 RepID=A0A835QZ44_VANPL|nr:hypothetical protein HPP92_026464 [Vanilla planifolia]KAG0479024.1 hypothetical protein HPP92_013743 [Vanilla planifolia]
MGQICSQNLAFGTSKTKKEQSKPGYSTVASGSETKTDLIKEEGKKKPHRYDDILKEADSIPKTSLEEIIKDGIFLKNRRKRFWLEDKTGYNCFILYARELEIIWGEDLRYWNWFYIKENSDVEIEVARLIAVCWLEVRGIFDTSYLNPDVTYEVKFLVMMENGHGWNVPIKLNLKLPDGSVQQHEEVLNEKQISQWFELKAGEFSASKEQAGEIEFSLCEVEERNWKSGLVVKGVVIRPKNSTRQTN